MPYKIKPSAKEEFDLLRAAVWQTYKNEEFYNRYLRDAVGELLEIEYLYDDAYGLWDYRFSFEDDDFTGVRYILLQNLELVKDEVGHV